MKKLSLLRDWTGVLFVIAILPLIFIPGLLLVYFFFPNLVPFTFSPWGSKDINVVKWLVLLTVVIGYILFVYSLYLFRKVLMLFAKKHVFHQDVIRYFMRIGKFIYYGLFIGALPLEFYLFFTQNTHELDSDKLVSYIFIGSLGLFFMVLGEIFQMAKKIKEENDLTV